MSSKLALRFHFFSVPSVSLHRAWVRAHAAAPYRLKPPPTPPCPQATPRCRSSVGHIRTCWSPKQSTLDHRQILHSGLFMSLCRTCKPSDPSCCKNLGRESAPSTCSFSHADPGPKSWAACPSAVAATDDTLILFETQEFAQLPGNATNPRTNPGYAWATKSEDISMVWTTGGEIRHLRRACISHESHARKQPKVMGCVERNMK